MKLSSQCTFTVSATFTPATCPTCCDGVIQANTTGPLPACAPSTWQILPSYAYSASGMWSNLCAGTYTVQYITGCCTIAGVCSLPYYTTSVKNLAEKKASITFYPNPAFDIINISSQSIDLNDSYIEFVDPVGRIVLEKNYQKEINITELINGVYTVQVKSSSGQIFRSKLIIAK